jgi:hypothetical protein
LHHFISLHGRRIFVRAPVIKAKASVVAGAIKLAEFESPTMDATPRSAHSESANRSSVTKTHQKEM